MKTKTIAVVFHVHVNTPHQHIPKLFIKNVPEDFNKVELKDALTSAGYQFGEFNIPWANHYIESDLSNAYPQVKGAYKRGDVESIEYVSLIVNSII